MAPHFIVLASEHRLRVLERFARPGQLTPTLREVIARDHTGMGGTHPPHQSQPERILHLSDYHNTSGAGAGTTGDADTLVLEERRRACEWLAEQIERFLMERPGQAWALAAAPHLQGSVLERLRPSVRGSMVESVQRNLIHLAPSELAVHFRVRA